MNANELADKWDAQGFSEYELERECGNQMANMLRQQQAEIEKWTDQYQRLNENLEMWKAGHFKQQAEIEALKQIIDANNLSQNIGQFVKPTNEPVAWTNQYNLKANKEDKCGQFWDKPYFDGDIPLYTHPVKELTDEEIWEVVSLKWWDWEDSFDVTGFARAILRKAQENDN